MQECGDTLHAEEICALVLAILHPWPIPAEEAFAILHRGKKKRTLGGEDIAYMREVGYTWKEIARITRRQNPRSTYKKYLARLKEEGAANGFSKKNEKGGSE